LRVSVGDVLVARPKSEKSEYFKRLDDVSPAPSVIPAWLKVNRKKLQIDISGLPTREDAEPDLNENLIVEYYSR